MRMTALVCASVLSMTANAAEDYRVMKLEQDMRNLERQVQTLQRQLNDLALQNDQPSSSRGLRTERGLPSANGEQKWLKAAAWDRVRTGMDELAVIEILGKPTAVRRDNEGRRSLLYTLEIGSTGFLTGSVAFEAAKVVEVSRPGLR